MGPVRILSVEDDPDIRLLLVRTLEADGYVVDEAHDVLTAMSSIAAAPPDLVLLDIGLPGTNGLELLGHLRRTSDVPVILLTAAGSSSDRVRGLRQGADDYIVKPFSPEELLARIESILRRSGRRAEDEPAPRPSPPGDPGVDLDVRSREVRVDGELVALTAREFDLLAYLAASPRQVFSREQLLRNVWGSSSEWQDPATVTEHVRRLRRKLGARPDGGDRIETVRGVGYRYET